MRQTTFVFCLALGVALTNGLSTRKVRDTDDHSLEATDLNSLVTPALGHTFRHALEARQLGEACKQFFDWVTTYIPEVLTNVITAIFLLPTEITLIIFRFAFPDISSQAVNDIALCWKQNALNNYGRSPRAAVASFDDSVSGKIYFAESLAREDTPSRLAVIGQLAGLTPGATYTVAVHGSGDVSSGCQFTGSQYSSLGEATVTADEEGKGLLLLEEATAKLEGTESVMGRSVVLTDTSGHEAPACATIVRNIVHLAEE